MPYWLQWQLALLLAIFSAIFAYVAPKDIEPWIYVHRAIIVFWTLGPPNYFLYLAQRIINDHNVNTPTNKEKFFYDSAAKFWAAVLVLLAGIYTSHQWLK